MIQLAFLSEAQKSRSEDEELLSHLENLFDLLRQDFSGKLRSDPEECARGGVAPARSEYPGLPFLRLAGRIPSDMCA